MSTPTTPKVEAPIPITPKLYVEFEINPEIHAILGVVKIESSVKYAQRIHKCGIDPVSVKKMGHRRCFFIPHFVYRGAGFRTIDGFKKYHCL